MHPQSEDPTAWSASIYAQEFDAPPPQPSIFQPTPDQSSVDSLLPPTQGEPIEESSAFNVPLSTALPFKGKEKELPRGKEKRKPLRLLDLPADILREIISQLPHTNDLTTLALCHSVLHALTIPCIYSRFDIVWPDEGNGTMQRSGVDALTYGLATLVMADEIFGEAPYQQGLRPSPEPSPNSAIPPVPHHTYPIPKRRRGNYYAKYTKKFSLGNGPPDWVQEYLITKEGGKMLGTLVALAVARMRSLESFIWDMPTGVLRDVWLALSSLSGRDGHECRLEKVWIRWHDNSSLDSPNGLPGPPIPPPPNGLPHVQPTTSSIPMMGINAPPPAIIPILDRVEHPTFSVLPPLKSLSVLDIDELPYLDEMSILIARSQHRLRELRIGIADQAYKRDWALVWDGDGLQQVDYNTTWTVSSQISLKRLGGVLGVLVGRVYNIRNNAETQKKLSAPGTFSERLPGDKVSATSATSSSSDTLANERVSGTNTTAPPSDPPPSNTALLEQKSPSNGPPIPLRSSRNPRGDSKKNGPYLNGVIRLETLELERVPLSVTVLQKAFDWPILTSLTLLHCPNHEQLWKMLRRNFSPTSPYNLRQQSRNPSKVRLEYILNLKKIHTNAVSPSLISFLKETLAPNSLEVLFLQERREYTSLVTIDQIYRGPIKRHRGSLKKLMIDSSDQTDDNMSSTRWKHWMLTREAVTYITSGRMHALRELGVTLDYRDWHYFLQRLPTIAHLRSLYIPHIADHAHGANPEPRELALQIVDIVTLRPEIELCYMGIASKCFEILENKPPSYEFQHDVYHPEAGSSGNTTGGYMPITVVNDNGELTDEDDEDDVDDDDDLEGDPVDDSQSESSDDANDDSDDDLDSAVEDKKVPRLRLREILFYDDKVSIFKARHGKL
ncbi:hypothetical protein EJ06DRAFT_582524 [Trichodelitschia bisporula]|uniref:F-box domain-containing protein n=1 Tax=Trichodelitschia bisporula TaxID=703511 RepID=A0A6G1HW15_9PEZI|nr:hypothetical protein EJ06DRAFT_582524 [Trichodelitschia bisporula]